MENTRPCSDTLTTLRSRLEALEGKSGAWADGVAARPASPDPGRVTAGVLHEVYGETAADAVTANAFSLGLAAGLVERRAMVWAMQGMAAREGGDPSGAGLNELGMDPKQIILVKVRDAPALLAVGEEALDNPAVGAVVLSAWGEAKAFSLTASRRLSLAAARGGGTVFLARVGADPAPSAAETRWRVRSALSSPLEAGAPGRPRVSATLTRHRGGGLLKTWIMEWDRETRSFIDAATLSGAVVSVPADRTSGENGERRRRAG
jgi:protein ImuA